MRAQLLFLSLLLAFSFPAAPRTIRFEPQIPPTSSFRVATHPTRADLFANLATEGEISLWRLTSSGPPQRLLTIRDEASAIALAHGPQEERETRVIAGDHQGSLRAYRGSDGSLLCEGTNPNVADITTISVDPNSGAILTGQADGRLTLWTLDCAPKPLLALKFSISATLAVPGRDLFIAASSDSTLVVLDAKRSGAVGRPVTLGMPANEQRLDTLATSPDGSMLAAGTYDSLRIYRLGEILDLAVAGKSTPTEPLVSAQLGALAMTFLRSSNSLAFADFDAIHIWPGGDLHKKRPAINVSGIRSLAATPDGLKIIAGFETSPFRVFDVGLTPSEPITRIASAQIVDLAFDSSNTVWAFTGDGEVRQISPDGIVGHRTFALNNMAFAGDITADGQHALIAGWGAHVTELATQNGETKNHFPSLSVAYVNPNAQTGHVVSLPERSLLATFTGGLAMWRLGENDPYFEANVRDRTVMDVAVSPSGSLIALALAPYLRSSDDSGEIIVLSRSDVGLRKLRTIVTSKGSALITHLAFSPDEEVIASLTSDDVVTLWRHDTGAELGHTYLANAPSSPTKIAYIDSSHLVIAADDGSLGVLPVGEAAPVAHLATWTPSPVRGTYGFSAYSMALSADRTLLAIGSREGFVVIWRLGLRERDPLGIRLATAGSSFGTGFPGIVCAIADSLACWSQGRSPVPVRVPSTLGLAESLAVHSRRRLVAMSVAPGNLVVSSLERAAEPVILPTFNIVGWTRWALNGRELYVVGGTDGADSIVVADVPDDFTLARTRRSVKMPSRISSITPLTDGMLAVELDGRRIDILDNDLSRGSGFSLSKACDRYLRFQPLAFSRSRRFVVASCDDRLLVMSVEKGVWRERFAKPAWRLPGPVAISPTEDLVAGAYGAGTVGIWRLPDGQAHRVIRTGEELVHLEFAGPTLIAGSSRGSLLYFDLDTRTNVGSTHVSELGALTVASSGWYSHDGTPPWSVLGFEGVTLLGAEAVAGRLSSHGVDIALFSRSSRMRRLVLRVAEVGRSSWHALRARPWYEQTTIFAAIAYFLFVGAILILWLGAPHLMASWSMRLRRSDIVGFGAWLHEKQS